MTLYNDPAYLISKQYHKPNNLNARIKLHELYSTGKQDWYGFVRKLLNLQPGDTLSGFGKGSAPLIN